MGSGNSKRSQRQDSLSSRSDSSVSSEKGSFFLYGQESYSYPPQQICSSDFAYPQPRCYSQTPPDTPIHGGSRKEPTLADEFTCIEQVVEALALAGLESCKLIVGIDFTRSNQWTGAESFGGRSLHAIGFQPNPYEQVITTIGKTLGVFSNDNLIPCYGFGDASTRDRNVFSFYPDGRSCNGFEEVLSRYREIVPHIKFSGPTSFAPIIEMAMAVVDQDIGKFHVLVIIADGQVTEGVDIRVVSPQETMTHHAINQARFFPLSIILVGVGDGPWELEEFCNTPYPYGAPFNFVDFTEIMSKNVEQNQKEAEFVHSALMELPLRYKAFLERDMLRTMRLRRRGIANRTALPPPVLVSNRPQSATSSTLDEQVDL
ncbi:PREDICTED: E3 ubiquitin-protein ligase RGLG2-like [Tarenaya hassleriana]|uniref:E3 ubiquitin-protein ligase RGLG2-like n=1 Tax=Tarenaya hassleriana TaxID=28532 RepID=UPI00053C9B12|nr:PREDICTED: E3 ubiquitin-protein ligase RGLG2-like [Tarenaya hassleriana]